ncbi:uncharacterized protein PY17X_0602300 [Plasmodium yoelii]|uniref:PIR protein n=3 Tax=Plasmodium yoelii TaxID=5861 RepID=A0AAE9WNN8_PLAYO|nr:uncharacterized protein PY17X_0602300 [Plasmodium yoelii]EAA16997.1 putative yir3 protein [Plasmodium yoelii yoelii]WBY55880.1 PIR protein [Plasmodium yoelii yoelii]CDU16875.1 YIR protein [Plasmodium yoelii]VTZ75126.1 PIR protein [Plasmodium yoelii]|eukprot:XP_725432.1 uncharacterized protein PY17X_0602300 [Plasmodium yoelii]
MDDICGKFVVLRNYLPDELDGHATLELKDITNFKDYCPKEDCDTELEKNTIGFLWLLGHCFYALKNKSNIDTNAFFIYIISWISYKLKQSTNENFTTIKDFFTNSVIDNVKYSKFTSQAFKISDLDEYMKKRNDLMNINIEDMSKLYDAFKLLCNMYSEVATNKDDNTLLDNANRFVQKYTELTNYNIEDTPRSQILSTLLTDYNNLKIKCKDCTFLPDITNISALASVDTSSSSSIGKRLFAVLSIFGAIAFFLGISYKYSLFGFRKRAQKQYLREKIKKIKKKMNH